MQSCEHLEDLLQYERSILKEQNHKEAYIARYGESMREMYCGHVCSYRSACELAKKYISQKPKHL